MYLQKGSNKRVVIAGMIGNALEWYDFVLYAQLASLISDIFFPSSDPYVSLIQTYGVFAAGFIVRPLGAVLFGYIGDTYGRRISLTISILMMAIPTACIGLLPSYNEIGIVAPIILIIIRLLQGLALGGELSGSITYVTEHCEVNKRGFVASTLFLSMMIGILSGAAVVSLFTNIMSAEEFADWGWRIPFISGLVIGLVGFYIRSFLSESPAYLEAKENGNISKQPFKELMTEHRRPLIESFLIYLGVTIPFYIIVTYMTGFMVKTLNYSHEFAITSNTLSLLLLTIMIPISAILSDKIGRKKVLVGAALAYLFFSYPAIHLITSGDKTNALIGQLIIGFLVGLYIAPVPALLVEVFPTRVRYTGMAFSCNVAAAIFGGTAPLVLTWLVQVTGETDVVSAYFVLSAFISLIALKFYKESYKNDLNI